MQCGRPRQAPEGGLTIGKDERCSIFTPTRFVPDRTSLPPWVEYAPVPFASYRIDPEVIHALA